MLWFVSPQTTLALRFTPKDLSPDDSLRLAVEVAGYLYPDGALTGAATIPQGDLRLELLRPLSVVVRLFRTFPPAGQFLGVALAVVVVSVSVVSLFRRQGAVRFRWVAGGVLLLAALGLADVAGALLALRPVCAAPFR